MSTSSETPAVRGRAAKRCAITNAALGVFARDGYTRASIDAIATEAGVSTRTIYNHFDGKEQLFAAILRQSATQVADGFLDKVAHGMTGQDLVADLVALGRAFAAQRTDHPQHFAMVRQIESELEHFPDETIRQWQEAGPERVQREVAQRLQSLADRGLLRLADHDRAAAHFSALVMSGFTNARWRAAPLGERRARAAVEAAVEAFLYGYQDRA